MTEEDEYKMKRDSRGPRLSRLADSISFNIDGHNGHNYTFLLPKEPDAENIVPDELAPKPPPIADWSAKLPKQTRPKLRRSLSVQEMPGGRDAPLQPLLGNELQDAGTTAPETSLSSTSDGAAAGGATGAKTPRLARRSVTDSELRMYMSDPGVGAGEATDFATNFFQNKTAIQSNYKGGRVKTALAGLRVNIDGAAIPAVPDSTVRRYKGGKLDRTSSAPRLRRCTLDIITDGGGGDLSDITELLQAVQQGEQDVVQELIESGIGADEANGTHFLMHSSIHPAAVFVLAVGCFSPAARPPHLGVRTNTERTGVWRCFEFYCVARLRRIGCDSFDGSGWLLLARDPESTARSGGDCR
jgi:hypothetical protein